VKLRPAALGAALGTVWGAAIFVTTWISYYTGYGRGFLEALAVSIYPGYSITPAGSFLGLAYGFADLFVAGFLVGWLYNRFSG